MLRIIALICVAAAAISSTSIGQAANLDSGTRVRITPVGLGGNRLNGTLISANKDSVTFIPSDMNVRIAYRTADVKSIEVPTGKHTHKLKWFLIGFASGGILGGGLTAATWHPTGDFDFGRWGDAAFIGVPSALLGGLIGFLAGMPAMESWRSIPLPGS